MAPPPAGVTSPDSILILRMREELGPDGRGLFLDVKTSTVFSCYTRQIQNLAVIRGRLIWIQFTGVPYQPLCSPAQGPARAFIPLGTLAEGSYDLVLTVRGQAQVTELTVTPQAFTVRPARGAWTVFEDSVLHRVTQRPTTGG